MKKRIVKKKFSHIVTWYKTIKIKAKNKTIRQYKIKCKTRINYLTLIKLWIKNYGETYIRLDNTYEDTELGKIRKGLDEKLLQYEINQIYSFANKLGIKKRQYRNYLKKNIKIKIYV